jgi:mannan endo-1,4-beta-mannosidase
MHRTNRAVALAVTLISLLGLTMCSAPGGALGVSGGKLVDSRGNAILLRGINYPYGWYAWRNDTAEQFAAMKATGANSVRLVLNAGRFGTATSPEEVSAAVTLCQANRLICILEVHDTTGFGEDGAAVALDKAADYFVSVKDKLVGLESFVIVNIGNEPYGNNQAANATWGRDTAAAVQKLRSAGFTHTLMVDGPGWGQDDRYIMRDQAPTVWAVDKNLVFSVHMYEVYSPANRARISEYLKSFTDRGLPIVVGEFGPANNGNAVDVDTIFSYTEANQIGWLAWSWSGNSNPVPLDMVNNFGLDPAQRSPWGRQVVEKLATAKEAAVWS